MSQGSFNPKIRLLGQKMWPVGRARTHGHTEWLLWAPFQGFRIFSFNLSSRIGPISYLLIPFLRQCESRASSTSDQGAWMVSYTWWFFYMLSKQTFEMFSFDSLMSLESTISKPCSIGTTESLVTLGSLLRFPLPSLFSSFEMSSHVDFFILGWQIHYISETRKSSISNTINLKICEGLQENPVKVANQTFTFFFVPN